jgi:tryptophan 2,3-dioxygenase
LLGIEEDPGSTYGDTILASLKRTIDSAESGPDVWRLVQEARGETSLRRALHDWLYRTPINHSSPGDPDDDQRVDEFLNAYLRGFTEYQRGVLASYPVAHGGSVDEMLASEVARVRGFLFAEDVEAAETKRTRRVRAALLFIESYRMLPLLAWPRLLLDTVVELESRILLWRTRHARMVERVIGQRVGTGGSPGASYLHKRAQEQIFTELWEVRSILLPRERVPAITNVEFYDFETRT